MTPESNSPDPSRRIEQSYDLVADAYAGLERDGTWPRRHWLTKLLHHLAPNSSVLDIGCGSGNPADVVLATAHRVTGIDISQQQLARARQNVPSGTFLHADILSVSFSSNTFDAIISFYTLEHIPRQHHATLLRRMRDWLRPHGLLLLSFEAGEFDDMWGTWLGVPMFLSCFSPEITCQMIQDAGLTLLERAIETQVEQGHEVPYLWILARRQDELTTEAD